MISSLSGLAPFPLLILLGIFFGAFKIFDLQNARTFNLFIFYVAIPCVSLRQLQKQSGEYKIWSFSIIFCNANDNWFTSFYITHKFFLEPKLKQSFGVSLLPYQIMC